MTEKNYIIIVAIFLGIFAIAGGIVGFSVLGEDAISEETLKLEEQNLYELEKNTTKDLESLMGNENISIDISSKDKIILTFKEEHSVLRVTYSTNYEIIEEQFINTYSTIGNNILAVTLGIILGFMASGPVTCSIVATYASYLEKKDIRRLRAKPKKQKKKRNELTVTQV